MDYIIKLEAENAALRLEVDRLQTKAACAVDRARELEQHVWSRNAIIEQCARAAVLQAAISDNIPRYTSRLRLQREPYAHEIGNEIADAIRKLKIV